MQAAAHDLFHNRKLPAAGTVPGVIDRIIGKECFRCLPKTVNICFLIQMKAAYQHIRTKMPGNIQNTFMGTPADQNPLIPFCDLQILLMTKCIRQEGIFLFSVQSPAVAMPLQMITVGEVQILSRTATAFHKNQSVMETQIPIQADVLFCSVIVGTEGLLLEINGSFGIDLQKSFQATTMVIMAMGKHRQICLRKIHLQCLGIARKCIILSHIEEDVLMRRFNIQAKTVLGCYILPTGCIFCQNRNPHTLTSFLMRRG